MTEQAVEAHHIVPEQRAAVPEQRAAVVDEAQEWLRSVGTRSWATATRVPLDAVTGWRTDPGAPDIRHDSGRFFRITGLRVEVDAAHECGWSQPIIEQPDVGILALVARAGPRGVQFLAQAKPEPGNPTGIQVAPTVQATRSNYLRAHGGRAVPLLDVVRGAAPGQLVADVRQSEHGTVFFRKRNRNMIIDADPPVPAGGAFRWWDLAELHALFLADDRVNMDTRTVLSCLPWSWVPTDPAHEDPVVAALARSVDPEAGSLHPTAEVLHWVTRARSETYLRSELRPLGELEGWYRSADALRHERRAWFDVIGVQVQAQGREIDSWAQPMIEPHGDGVLGLLVARFGDVLHLLVRLRTEPGLVDSVEIAPTVQHRVEEPADLANPGADDFLDLVRDAPPDRVVYDCTHSDEGGRFYRSAHRHVVVEVDPDADLEGPDLHWVTLHQLADLLRHSHYVNLQLRSLLSCLQAVSTVGRPSHRQGR